MNAELEKELLLLYRQLKEAMAAAEARNQKLMAELESTREEIVRLQRNIERLGYELNTLSAGTKIV